MARLLLLLCLSLLGCSPRAGVPTPPAREAGQGAPHAEPGVTPTDAGGVAPHGKADGGACPAGQERCCDGQCNTPSACLTLSCDPKPPPVEQER